MADHKMGNNPERDGYKYNFGGGVSGGFTLGGSGEDGIIRDQDRLLPIANVGRIMKQILPPNAKISKEAKETMQECVSEFISFVTGEASDKCHKEKRKTVNGDDICWAMATLGFDNYAEQLKRYLHRYRELEGERANQNKAGSTHEEVSNYSTEPPGRSTVPPPTNSPMTFNVFDRKSSSLF
ncbi:hypothetical protein SLEP1_g1298 [Rubroshorea leprosula]|uniref:Transcription factor CBF/NF-Y/archaeal histone domain-containing protein n=1 Tax=Rubroshorea leprosula TaxID=152421 RepID=A0AAV5HDD9_9ROSI|nr:hypothetical protein SLEP1_g1298 [Rubroshorea leprosula]